MSLAVETGAPVSHRLAWLHGRSPAPDDALGGKAATLRRLARAGQRVPEGFCLSAHAYREQLEVHGLAERVAHLAARLPDDRARAELAAVAATPRPLAPGLAEEVERAVERLAPGGELLAVRSSALGEDGHVASFAGQHVTELGVGPEGVAATVSACWASLWSPEAIAYRRARDLPFESLAMPVLVQRLVPAEAAAVAFSTDPLDSDSHRMVVNATRGLGLPLVSGDAVPDTFCFDRGTLECRWHEPGVHDTALVVRDGSVSTDLSSPEGHAPAIDVPVAAELAETCLDVESALGFPVDVEACYADGRWWLVQARPITTM